MTDVNCVYGAEPQPGVGLLWSIDDLDLEILLVAVPTPYDIILLAALRLLAPYNPVYLCAEPFPGWPEFTAHTLDTDQAMIAWAQAWGRAVAWKNL
jgi:hypothetical protein